MSARTPRPAPQRRPTGQLAAWLVAARLVAARLIAALFPAPRRLQPVRQSPGPLRRR